MEYPTSQSYREYLDSKGLITSEVLASSARRYGNNIFDIPMPTFWDLYKEQALAPFFVFQVFCVALWCLDDYFYYSLFILFMLLVFEATTAKSRLNNVQIFRGMAIPETKLLVYRTKQWVKMSSTELMPGDVALLRRTEEEQVVPCDFLLLTGHCITNEAMLTGESTPQMKEPLSSKSIRELSEGSLDINRDKLHVIFGGTKILQHSNPDGSNGGQIADVLQAIHGQDDSSYVADRQSALNVPDGCLCYVLRTGFQTSQGKLVRTILYSSERVTENNRESFLFIFILLLFALAASGYVLYQGLQDETRSRWKLMLSCTLIITSVVPPELPMQLSLAVTSSLLNLTKEGVFCTEPFRIPYAGKVDFAAFDKTGTLTQEHLNMKGVVLIDEQMLGDLHKLDEASKPSKNKNKKKNEEEENDAALDAVNYSKVENLPDTTSFIMAGCHSLSVLEREVIGDPIESAALKHAGWTLSKSDVAKKGRFTVQIRHRFHFNSALKRMSVIASVDQTNYALVKGAPEVVMQFLSSVPEHYEYTYKTFARRGARIIAMAYRQMQALDVETVRSLKREDVEHGLTFAGFLVFECPLKPDSKEVIAQLQESSHTTVMITGDAALTACEVARRLHIVEKPVLILEHDTTWVSLDEETSIPYDLSKLKQLAETYDLCLAGSALANILAQSVTDSSKGIALTLARVFARASPEDKTGILAYAKKQGSTTLMCGDGTNDVGALKQAHVGIALLVNAANDPRLKKLTGGGAQAANPTTALQGPAGATNPATVATASANPAASATPRNTGSGRNNAKKTSIGALSAAMAAASANAANRPQPQSFREALTQAQQVMSEASEEEAKIVQLGDASVAAPFTSKGASIRPLLHILRQGRCTLVTTMQMFKILALNSLIYAYSLSVLYMDGIKFGDTQATIMALLSATCFLFISRSQPLNKLSKERPVSKLFSPYMVCSVIGQFLIHLTALMFVHHDTTKDRDPTVKMDSEVTFEPSIVNTAIFLLSASQQLSTFAVNYQGHPFMQSIRENKGLFICLMATFGIAASCVLQIVPEFNTSFDLVILPTSIANNMLMIMVADFAGSWVWEKACKWLLK